MGDQDALPGSWLLSGPALTLRQLGSKLVDEKSAFLSPWLKTNTFLKCAGVRTKGTIKKTPNVQE